MSEVDSSSLVAVSLYSAYTPPRWAFTDLYEYSSSLLRLRHSLSVPKDMDITQSQATEKHL